MPSGLHPALLPQLREAGGGDLKQTLPFGFDRVRDTVRRLHGRAVDIAQGTVALLREHRRVQAELKMKNRQSYADFDLVFAKQWNDVRRRGEMLGHPLQLNNLGQREYARLIRESGVPRIKFHGLRHTCATLLLNAGEPVHNVSKRLGHKSVMMTMEVYAHLLDGSGKQMAATMGAILHG